MKPLKTIKSLKGFFMGHNKIIKTLFLLLLLTLFLSFPTPYSVCINAQATETGDNMTVDGSFNLKYGGVNSYNGKDFTDKSDAVLTENQLRKNGYILISTDRKEISDEDFQILKNMNFWFNDFIDDKLRWQFDKIYIYKPLLDKCINEQKNRGALSEETVTEVMDSTVVFAYEYWHFKDKIGQLSDEFNDNIPDYFDSGYIEINTTENMVITLIHWDLKTYYRFYVSKNTPFMVRLPLGHYKVADINAVEIGPMEQALPLSNMVYLTSEYSDRDNPYVMDVSKVINKYIIPEGDISGMPDLSLDKNQNIPEERTVVDEKALKEAQERSRKAIEEQSKQEQEEQENKTSSNNVLYLSLGVTLGILLIWVIVNKIKSKKTHYREDEDDGDDYSES